MTHYGSLIDIEVGADHHFEIQDYQSTMPRWCPGCGDHSVLTAFQRLMEHEQLKPEETVFVSGIGCSGRFPQYVNTYGFHGLHGRALPVATGIKLERPMLHVFVVMGDGDCCSIGGNHWLHATRYNMDMLAVVLDNGMYAMTKGQTSPTTPEGFPSNTQPHGSYLRPVNPVATTLGMTNVSFVAQTAEWIPAHLLETLRAAYHHKGFSLVRILQRCPIWTAKIFEDAIRNPDLIELLIHDDGVWVKDLHQTYRNTTYHDPRDLNAARSLAEPADRIRLGVLYRNEKNPRYEEIRRLPAHTAEERIETLNRELDRFAV
ncbi:MAG: thiamine pyrophosphate-dependent enzyme [Gemmatimonadales bacterium]|jgi:2-oxoglutarate ferredoxin oxidoreductase subunit beta